MSRFELHQESWFDNKFLYIISFFTKFVKKRTEPWGIQPSAFLFPLMVGYTAFLAPTHGRVHRFFGSHLVAGYSIFFEYCYSVLILYATHQTMSIGKNVLANIEQ